MRTCWHCIQCVLFIESWQSFDICLLFNLDPIRVYLPSKLPTFQLFTHLRRKYFVIFLLKYFYCHLKLCICADADIIQNIYWTFALWNLTTDATWEKSQKLHITVPWKIKVAMMSNKHFIWKEDAETYNFFN